MRISDWSSDVCSSDLRPDSSCWDQACPEKPSATNTAVAIKLLRMRIAVLLRVDAPPSPTGRRRRRIDCSRRFDAKRRKPSQHAEEQGVSATRWRRPPPEGRKRGKMTPKHFMAAPSPTDAHLALTPPLGKYPT